MKYTGFKKTQLALATALSAVAQAQAGVIDMDNGMQAVWSLNASMSAGWRTKDADPQLIGKGDGGTASSYTAGLSDKNFGKGEMFSELFRVVGDVDLKSGDNGLFLRAKVWDNQRLSSQAVGFGAPTNKFAANTKLSDAQFDTNLSKFSGAELLDAYAYTRFDISDDIQAKVKLGKHVVNFGESLFIPGVNQYSVLDVNALRQPGTLIKEAILPVPQISANVSLPGGVSMEGFYQFQWLRTSLDGCGTYWSSVSALNCTNGTLLLNGDIAAGSFSSPLAYNGVPALGGANFKLAKLGDRTSDNPNQFGVSFKKTVESLDTEFGGYFSNYTTHIPIISVVRAPGTVPGSVYYAGGTQMGAAQWDYSAQDIQVSGLSASTVLGGWAVAGELSYTKDFPVQISANDVLAGGIKNVGPVVSRFGFVAAPPNGSGQYLAGYDRKDKVQIQISTIKAFSNVLGASAASLVGEVAYQHWNGIGDPYTSVRYGRGFEFGNAQHAAFGGACPAAATNPANCTQDGYFTSNAWGLRMQVELDYPNVFAGVNLKPRLFLSKDVKGWSADSVFSEGRQVVSLGLRAEYLRKYYLDVSATMYNPNARFDSFHDRDNIGLLIGASF